jgi:hypothetical protein
VALSSLSLGGRFGFLFLNPKNNNIQIEDWFQKTKEIEKKNRERKKGANSEWIERVECVCV